MAYEQKLVPPRNEIDRTGETAVYDGRPQEMKPTVASAVRSLRERMPAVRPKGIFQHPDDWTDEEIAFIADSLKMNVPIYTIANMVHCERHTLGRLIERTPELRQLKEDKYENLLDEAEYQADRLMKAGNSSLVIYVLQTLGRKRGWGADGAEGTGGDEDSKIVMGIIPDEEVEKAEEAKKELAAEKPPAAAAVDPLQMAMTEEAVKAAVKEEVDKRMDVVEAEPERVDPSPLNGLVGMGEMTEVQPMGDDPWAEGANSPFFQ